MQNNLYTIPADLPFADTLARWILEKYGHNPASLSRVLILLPTRRSCAFLRESFLRATDGKPMLLPRMRPIGDVDEDILLSSEQWSATGQLPEEDYEFKRLLILARLVEQKNRLRMDHALRLAAELARLFDEMEREQIAVKEFANLVPQDFAEHWQITTEFLKIISEYWPQICKDHNITSRIHYRNAMLASLTKTWRDSPPDYPVIVAGTTGSIPASADLIAAVAGLPGGMIMLPGFDVHAGKDYFAHVNESHAMWGMYALLQKLKCDVHDVQEIRVDGMKARKERVKLLSEIMRPAETSENWQRLELDVNLALQGIKRIECDNLQEEATVIALLLRETLETPEKTAALVTHDRNLARRVSSIIKRFDVEIDDSAGQPLMQTPIAAYLRLLSDVAVTDMEPLALVCLLKHPLSCAGMERIGCLEATRDYEVSVLRNPHLSEEIKLTDNVKTLLQNVKNILAPFVQALKQEHLTLSEALLAHMRCAEAFACSNFLEGEEAEDITTFLQQAQTAGGDFALHGASAVYNRIFDLLLAGKIFRREYGGHKRLKILSPIEARMQHFDRIILGGLNEGSWPQTVEADPWLNRAMRMEIGLSAPERIIGLAAHDFFIQASSPEVFLTRSMKIGAAPAIVSRWLVKLDVILSRFGAQETIEDDKWRVYAAQLDEVEKVDPQGAPRPTPPMKARSKTLSVTQVETLLRNPYAIYAAKILGLKPLEEIVREPRASDFGNAVHKALEQFVRKYPKSLPDDAYDKLLELGRQSLEKLLKSETAMALWWPRFMQIAEFVVNAEKERRGSIKTLFTEMEGSYKIGDFTLTGRADRVEQLQDGSINIIDYKTGTLPTDADIEKGLASQLVLLGVILQHQMNAVVNRLEYWQLRGGRDRGKIKPVKKDIEKLMQEAEQGLTQLIEKYKDASFAYLSTPIPARAGRYNDYEHLARILEWS